MKTRASFAALVLVVGLLFGIDVLGDARAINAARPDDGARRCDPSMSIPSLPLTFTFLYL